MQASHQWRAIITPNREYTRGHQPDPQPHGPIRPAATFREDTVSSIVWDIQQANKQVTPGRVVVALSFGAWVTFLSSGYGRLWSDNNQRLLKMAFPNAPVGMQYRNRIHERFNIIRQLRNSVFHHEPIFDDPNLLQKHADIIEAIGWVSPIIRASVVHFDRFPTVYNATPADVEVRLKNHLGIP